MPIYDFKCQICGATASVQASMDSDIDAPKCDTDTLPMSRDYSSPDIIFRGAGFYKNDSRGKK